MTDEEAIGRIALRMHEMLAFDSSPRCYDLARAAHAEMKLIAQEDKVQSPTTSATMMDEARIPRDPAKPRDLAASYSAITGYTEWS